MIRLDPKLMIAFAVIAQERSFTRAAERLRVAQPWLSARFAKLESLLGFRLLDRTTRSVTLTDRGATLLPVAEEMLRVSQQADRLSLQIGRTGSAIRKPHGLERPSRVRVQLQASMPLRSLKDCDVQAVILKVEWYCPSQVHTR